MLRHRTLHRWTLAALTFAALTLAIANTAGADPVWRHGRHGDFRYAGPGRVVVMHDGAGPMLAGLIGGFVLGAALTHPRPVYVEEHARVAPPPVYRDDRGYREAPPRYRYEDGRYDRYWDTLDECREAALDPHGPRVIKVVDARTGEDLTRSTLTQIIFEQESKGYNLLPTNFLRQIIKFYDDSLGAVLPDYLDKMMQNFMENQERMRTYMSSFTGGFTPFQQGMQGLEEMRKRNLEIFQNTMSMFNPFAPKGEDGKGGKKG
jgi:polyhydroxyalkanoate synthesis repressor PhaR